MATDAGGAPLTIELLPATDADELTRLVRRVYGEDYLDADVYDIDALRTRIETGLLISVVARTDSGRVVGHMATMLRRVGGLTADSGMTIVDPDYRGHRLSGRLGSEVTQQMRRLGLVGYHHYPVLVNTVTPRLGLDGGGVESGFMFAHLSAPATARAARQPTTLRSASMILYQPMGPGPARRAHLPDRHVDVGKTILQRSGLDRELGAGGGVGGHRSTSRITHDPGRGRMLVSIETVGPDAVAHVAQAGSAPVTHVDLPLTDAATPQASEELRRLGFFFAGVLPEYDDGDVLRLQRIESTARPQEPPRLVSAAGEALWAYIEADEADLAPSARTDA